VSQWKVLLEKTGVMGEMDVMERMVAEDAEDLVGLQEEEGGLDLQGLGGQKDHKAHKAQKAQKAQKDHKVLRGQRAIASQIPIIYGR
jgi:hypothetical protein